jgi:serine/threonine protein kinase
MFALGVVLFNLLFGKMPFGTSLLSNAFKVMRLADSDWQWDVNEDEDVQELLEGLFNPNLEERWDTEDLQQCAWMNQDTCT